jgi:hypothetical protein
MKIRSLLVFICSLFILFQINAQSVTDYFHTSAKFYVDGEKANAKKTIQEAIKKYPNDPKLKKLASAIDKLPEDKKDNKDKKNQEKKEQENKDQEKQDQDKKGDQQKQDQKNQQQKQGQQPQMSKENAQQILDALMQDEKSTQDKAKKQQVKATKKADKDW